MRFYILSHGDIVADEKLERNTITIGSQIGADLIVSSDICDHHVLVRKQRDGYQLNLPRQFDALLSINKELHSEYFETLADSQDDFSYAITLRADDWAVITLDKRDVVLHVEPKAVGAGWLASLLATLSYGVRSRLALSVLFSFIVQVGIVFLGFWLVKPHAEATQIAVDPRTLELTTAFQEDDSAKEIEEPEVMPIESEEDVLGAPDEAPEGPLDTSKDKNTSSGDGDDRDLGGIHSALQHSNFAGDGSAESLFGSSADLGAVSDQLIEGGDAAAGGPAGYGIGIGTGRAGGGGRGGGLGGIGRGSGGGSGGKKGGSGRASKKRVKIKGKIKTSSPVAGKFCKESDIKSAVTKRRRAIIACYETQLLADPSLAGKLTAQWRIGLDGKVASVSIVSSTIKNKRVEACVEKVIRRLRFAKPNGGICVVKMPFSFSHD